MPWNVDQPELVLRSLTSKVLWLGAVILIMLAGGMIYIASLTYTTHGNNLGSLITLSLGVNFLTGAAGAALFEILIRRPQEQERAKVASQADVVAVGGAIDQGRRDLEELSVQFSQVTTFIQQHAKAAPLEDANIAQMFSSRTRAAAAMRESAERLEGSEIRIMGITLNDFLTHSLAWSAIQRYLTGKVPLRRGNDRLSVKIVVCDPKSLAAYLLDMSGSSDKTPVSITSPIDEEYESPLEADFRHVVSRLRTLLNRPKSESDAVTFEFRIYRGFPPNFLFSVGHTTFVQPYYLHKYDAERPEMPVLKYDAHSTMSVALQDEFDVIWNAATASPDSLIRDKPVRVEGGAARSGIVEVYTSASAVRVQLERLLRGAEHRVLMQGVSNVPIIRGELNDAFIELVNRKDVTVQILMLDPRCEAAKQKTFARYQSTRDPRAGDSWEAYKAASCSGESSAHESSDIYDNIHIALNWFQRVARDANREAPGKVRIRLCNSVEAFIMVADDCVLFEPYHFGNEFNVSFPAETPLQLAGNMPSLEFHEPRPRPFPPRRGENVSTPLEVCVSHFERVFNEFAVDVPDDLFDS